MADEIEVMLGIEPGAAARLIPAETARLWPRWIRIGVSLGLLAGYGFVLVCGGHGVGFIWQLLLGGSLSAWGLPMILGWAGIVGEVGGLFFAKNAPWISLMSSMSLWVSFLLFVVGSETPRYLALELAGGEIPVLTLLLTPFVVFSTVRAVQLYRDL